MPWIQKTIKINVKQRGPLLVTDELLDALPEISGFKTGLLNIFLKHTSASIFLNENTDPNVAFDLEQTISKLIPDGHQYSHSQEGPDDMSAHVKTSLFGTSLTVPINQGKLCLGTWQGVYLFEHRKYPSLRTIVLTAFGE